MNSTAQEVPFSTNGNCTLGEAIHAANTNTVVDGCIAGTGDDTIFGGEGDDRLGGDAGHDTISGDGGHDTIWGDSTYDQIGTATCREIV